MIDVKQTTFANHRPIHSIGHHARNEIERVLDVAHPEPTRRPVYKFCR
jgi:hypothetical protein